ncbi:MAG: c-type cytochrome, partial [Mucilaginibacter sp.]|nr:c-type cytochrome [Mucilaginibacter sp.]
MLAMNKIKILGTTAFVIAASIVLTSCKDKRSTGWEYAPNMYEHKAYEYDQANDNFKNGQTAQTPPAGTIPVGFKKFDYPNNTAGYQLASTEVKNPLPLTSTNIEEGKKLFTTFCSPCHGVQGQGDGLVVSHGYPPPPSYSKGQSS